MILPGMCYRYEQVTARSEMMFHQVEGLAVGRNITMADLKGTIVEFAHQLFGAGRKLRFRCSHFPFTEPSVEVDVDCILCDGKGCGVCKYTGWLEIMGAGMVHPVVLRNGGYDPAEWSGFAFGMGPERIAMLKHGITTSATSSGTICGSWSSLDKLHVDVAGGKWQVAGGRRSIQYLTNLQLATYTESR